MGNMKNWKRSILMLLVLALCVFAAGCKKTDETTTPQQTQSPSAESTEPVETQPSAGQEKPTEPEEEEPTEFVIDAGVMKTHPKGKNGDLGIYFTMEENDIPVDATWVTEYRPTAPGAILLYRNGETLKIGNTATGMIIKFSETEYYLKLEQWNIRDNFPIRDGDVIKVEGEFWNAGLEVTFKIQTSHILISEGLVFFSEEYPDENAGVSVINAGAMSSHPNGKTTDGIYFTMEKNSVPYDGWSIEYSPASEDAIQLIRNGNTYNIGNKAAGTIVKYNKTDYYLKLEKWIIKDYYPIRDGDILVVNGKFVNSGVSTVFRISKTYIAIEEGLLSFSTEYPTGSSIEAVQIPTMNPHPNGFTGTGVYFTAEPNSLPFDGWSVEYFPREQSCIKLIRGGETYDIGNVNAGTIVKYSETGYYFKLEQWMYKDYFPFVDGDIILVEGKFVNSGLAGLMEMGKTYIAISSGMAYFSTEYPNGPIGPTQIHGGTMSSHPDGWNSSTNGGLFFRLDANDAPYAEDWSLRYTPSSASAVKLIRDGVTYDVANTGAEMLVKYRQTDYYLEFWPISQKPIVEGDVLVVEGNFVNAVNDVVLIIDKTYITIENGEPVFSTSVENVIEAGYMGSHNNGWNTASNDGLYFTLSVNEVPYSGWHVEYEPVSAASIQLIRGGETSNIGIPGRGTIVKYSDTEYYLKLAAWTIGDYAPIVPGDTLIVEGKFKNADNGVIFNISRSIITVGEDYSLTFTTEEPVDSTIQAGPMQSHPNGWNTANNKGMYFSLASNEVPYSDDWTTVYYPTATGNIQLVRDGQTVDLAQTDREYIVKFGDTDYYLKLEKWTIGDYFPLVPGDLLIVEGDFINALSGVTFNISKSYITIGEGYTLNFSEQAPEEDDGPIEAGALSSHPKGFNTDSKDGLYATMAANAAPYDGWKIEYTPVEAASYKLVRDGVTYNIGIPGRGTLVKYSDTEYYLKFGWCVGDYANTITIGDTLIVEGLWKQNTGGDAVMNITKTTITIGENYVLTFQGEGAEPEDPDVTEPDVSEPETHGPMAAHSENGWTGTGGLYFTMAANNIPYNSWEVRYTPTKESNVKLIRGGATYDVGHTQRETIVKYSDTEYYFEFWTLGDYKPIVAGDVMIVEGDFVNAANGATLRIAKTTITFNADGTATFQSDAEPEEPEVTEPTEPEATEPSASALPMLAWDEKGWNTSTNGGFWFTMDTNEIPADETWALEYTPVSEDVIKLVRGGETVNIAIPGRGTFVKANDAEYYLKLEWNIGDYSGTITVGDMLIVEGDFTNAENGVTFTVAKTYITIGENYQLTFSEEEPVAEGVIQAGVMAAHSSGLKNGVLYFTMEENDVPYHLTKARYAPVSAGVIKLVRDGVTYEIGDPTQQSVQKTTKSNYKITLSMLAFGDLGTLQEGDLLIVNGEFTGGNSNTGETATFKVTKTYISITDGAPVFSATDPRD